VRTAISSFKSTARAGAIGTLQETAHTQKSKLTIGVENSGGKNEHLSSENENMVWP
jgi:hypothetical protein